MKFEKNFKNWKKVGKVGNIIGCQLTQKVTKYTHL